MKTLGLGAVDLGNTSGRVVHAAYDGSKIQLSEVHRFVHGTVPMHRFLKENFTHLLRETIIGLAAVGDVSSIGIDSWAVDFGFLDSDDDLVLTPHHHRDQRSQKAIEKFDTQEKQWKWYSSTGITFQPINTSMQLLSMVLEKRAVLENAKSMLMIPDLVIFFLTGAKITEATNASNTQLISLKSQNWDADLIEEIGISNQLFQEIVSHKTPVGHLRSTVVDAFALSFNPEIITVGSHDTASAVHATPLIDRNSVFISSGTWSLFGTVLDEPFVTMEAMRLHYNNERATDGRIRFLKNSIGMWIVEELMRVWSLKDGEKTSYDEMFSSVERVRPFDGILDPNRQRFFNPYNMEDEIRKYLAETGQSHIQSRASIIRMVLEGMAFSYREAFDSLKGLLGTSFQKIHIIGGGARNYLLNQYTANVCNVPVLAGPVEATALGNVLSQLEYHGEIHTQEERFEVVRNSYSIQEVLPKNQSEWEERYQQFLAFSNGKERK